MKKLLLATLLGSLTFSAAASAQTTELTMSSWLPPTHAVVADFLLPWAAEVEKETEGRVKMRLLAKPVTNPQGHFDAVRTGLADITFISHAYYPGRFDLAHYSVLPFSGDTAESRSVAAWTIYEKYLLDKDEHRGVKVLGMYTHGPGMVFTSNKPVKAVEDFDGLKIRVGGGMAAEVAKAMGATVIAKPAPESYELLSTGVVDGVFFPAESIQAFKLDSVINYATTVPGGLYSDSHGVIMNQKAYDALSDTDRTILDRLSGAYMARMAGQAWDKHDSASRKVMADTIEVTQADDALIKAIRERTQPILDNWLAAMDKHGLDGNAVLQEFQDEIKQLDNAPAGS